MLWYTNNKEECVVLVYDFGGGTLDVSLLNINNGVFEVLGTSGNTHLGGIDFDERLCSYIISDMNNKCGEKLVSISQEKLYGKVRSKCEQLKKDLSSAKKAYFEFDELDYERTISREEFILCKDIFKKCLDPVTQVINDCEVELREIDEIVLVGGSSRIPYIETHVIKIF